MSCGGNRKGNRNQAALQDAFKPHLGTVPTSLGPEMFHALTAERRDEIKGALGNGPSDMEWRRNGRLALDNGYSCATVELADPGDVDGGYTCDAVWADGETGEEINEERTVHPTVEVAKAHAERLAKDTARKRRLHVTQESHAYARANIARVVDTRAAQVREALGSGSYEEQKMVFGLAERQQLSDDRKKRDADALSARIAKARSMAPPAPPGTTYEKTVSHTTGMRPGDVILEPGYRDTDLGNLAGKTVREVHTDDHRVKVAFTDGTDTTRRGVFDVDRPHTPEQQTQHARYQEVSRRSLTGGHNSTGWYATDPETSEDVYDA